MAKTKSVWFCTSCGNESSKWMGKCPACGEWNTMVEETIATGNGASRYRDRKTDSTGNRPVLLKDIGTAVESRISSGSREVDRVLGGGIVKGSIILLGGEPGIGKSTLSLQIPLFDSGIHTLYVSGEESPEQIRLRSMRLGGKDDSCHVLCETRLENILDQAAGIQHDLLIIDSIQTMYTDAVESSPGTVTQVRECSAKLLGYAKSTGIPVILIGHITKDGILAGPKVLEHIVDVVLQFEGDTRNSYRILRGIKNRFGSTSELAVFEMTVNGLEEVENPSGILLPVHEQNLSGIAVASMMDGSRPSLVETQALVGSAAYGTPQRSATGFDIKRMNMLIAVLEKRGGLRLGNKDIFLNIAGGFKVNDTAIDLAVAAAVMSSGLDIPVPENTCFMGEIGLSGEIRPVGKTEARLKEASKLGYSRIFTSSYTEMAGMQPGEMELVKVNNIRDFAKKLFR